LQIVWPFPRSAIARLSKQVNTIIVPEMCLGQIVHPIKEFADPDCKIVMAPKVGGEMHLPVELVEIIEKEAK